MKLDFNNLLQWIEIFGAIESGVNFMFWWLTANHTTLNLLEFIFSRC